MIKEIANAGIKTKILIVEHDLSDIELMENVLKKGGINYVTEIVKTESGYINALNNFVPDLILSDYTLPSFAGLTAFKIKEKTAPDTPFIFVTGTVGEELSIELIKGGVTDYVLKDNLITLTMKVSRALKEAKEKEQKKQTEYKLVESESKFRHTLDSLFEGIQLHDFNWRYIYANDALVRFSGYTREELLGFTVMEKYPGIEQTDLFKSMQRCMTDRVPQHLETVFVFPDGTKGNFELSIQPIAEGISILSIDKTSEKLAKMKMLKANRLYAFISQVNQNIVRVKDEETLFRNACSIALEYGKFKMAWVGAYDPDHEKIKLVEQSGMSSNDVTQYANDLQQMNSLQDSVLSTGACYVCNDIEHDFPFDTRKSFMTERGYLSCMILPIKKSGNIIGTFNLYSHERHYFDVEEIALLEIITGDISFALDMLEKAKKQKEIEALLIQNENRFRSLIENSSDMKTLSNRESQIIYASPSVEKILGYTMEEFSNKYPHIIHPEDIGMYLENRNKLIKTPAGSFHFEQRLRHKNGNWIWCEGTVTNMLDKAGINALVSNFRNISEKKLRENEKEFDKNNLHALINNTKDLMWSVDKNFNLITSNQPFEEMSRVNFGNIIPKGGNVLSVSYNPEMMAHFKGLYERAFAGESFTEIDHFDYPVEMWTEISYFPILKGTEVVGTACHSRDITKIKEAEMALRKSEAFNLGVLNSLSSHIAVIDNVGNILAVNEAWQRFANENGETTIQRTGVGSNYFKACVKSAENGDAVAREALNGIQDVLEKKRTHFYLEYPCHSPDEQRWFGMRAKRFESDEALVVVAHTDITERKLGEINLLNSEARLKEAQAVGHIGDWKIDLTTNIHTWSDEFYRIYGIRREDVTPSAETFVSFMHPDDVIYAQDKIQEAFISLKPSSFNFRFKRKDGVLRYGYTEWKFEFDKKEKPIYLYGILQDVTERREAEILIIESEARLAEAQRLTKMGNWNFDINADKLTWSEELYRVFDTDKQTFIETHGSFLHLVDEEDREMALQTSKRTQQTGEPFTIEYHITTAKGEKRIIQERGYGEKDDKGIVIRLFGTAQDITERKKDELKLEQQNKELLKTNTELDRFVYSTSHDLRAPLASLLGLIEMVNDDIEPGNKLQMEHMGMMKQSVLKLDNFIEDILNYSRNARTELTKEDLHFEDMIKEVRSEHKFMEGTGGFKLKVEVKQTAAFSSDKRRVNVVLNNLISNAIKYKDNSKEKSFVHISVISDRKKATIVVEDNGIGIAEKDKEKIFEMFYRATKQSTGSGIGLYIVKETIDKLGATIQLESEKSVGSKFIVTIPNLLSDES